MNIPDKIPDYFPDYKDNSKYAFCFPFSMIIADLSGCGKTNVLIHML